jgi:hypothetical protein
MKLVLIAILATICVLSASAAARADTAYFARLGYDYPPTWGAGPFTSITACNQEASNIYGADAYKWHCELRTYIGIPDRSSGGSSYAPQSNAAPATKWYARLGYSYPEQWGAGPFTSLTQCNYYVNQIYGADAFKYHCEIHI